MATTLPIVPFKRAEYLKSVPAGTRATAEQLCDALERAFGKEDIVLYSNFPVVIRDGEWHGGFAMRASGPMAYGCSARAIAKFRAETAPLMSGKGCMKIKATKTTTVDDAIALIERVWVESAKGTGSISQADAKKRDRARKAAGADAAPVAAKRPAKKTLPRAATKPAKKSAGTTSRKPAPKPVPAATKKRPALQRAAAR